LLGDPTATHRDALRILFRRDGDLKPAVRAAAERFVERCRSEAELEELLGTEPTSVPRPTYSLPRPRGKMQAVRQGEDLAEQERRRLNLGSEPLRNPLDLLEQQGVRIGELTDAGGVDGLYVELDQVGACIAVNLERDLGRGFRSAFTACHEYAHWIVQDVNVESFSFGEQETDPQEVRANAFAAAFLMPEAGLRAYLARTGLLIGGALARFGVGDVVLAMDHFGVSQPALLFRLQNLGLLDRDKAEVLRKTQLDLPGTARALGLKLRRETKAGTRLYALAAEAWQKGLISAGRAADLMGIDIASFRTRMNLLGVRPAADDSVLSGV